MKNKIIAILSALFVLLSGACVEAVEYGTDLLNENFDSGFGNWVKEGNPTIESVKGTNAVVLGEKETVTYNPKANELGWEDSYRATFRLKTKDWSAQGNPTMLFRMKSQGGSQVYLIYYNSQGFGIQRLNPTLPSRDFLAQGWSGSINADASQWHDISIDAIRNLDKSMTLRIYFDGEKQLEVIDTDVEEMPITGGVMFGNWMADNKVYLDSVTVQPIIIKNDTSNPDDPATDTIGTNYEEDATLLRLLGIMDNYTDKLFKGDFIMTREEFVKCVVSMLGYDEMAKASNGKCSFTDVTETMAGYVSTAEHLGIISGVGNDKFEPERALTFDEAVKILVCALGYDMGDLTYPLGYKIKAGEIGLLKGIVERDTSRGSISRLIVNALDIPIIEFTGNKYGIGDTILEHRGIYSGEGILTDDGITSYTGTSAVSKDRVCIDHVNYKSGITSANKYFAQKVSYYYQDNDGDYELIYIRPTDDNVIYTVDSDDFDSKTTKQTAVFYKNDKKKQIKISPVCNFVYNGKVYPEISDAELIPKDGKITLIDNNKDNSIDAFFISDYITVVVQNISENTKTVYNMISGTQNLILDEKEKTIDMYKGDEKIQFSQIKTGDVIKAAISRDKEYIKLMISSNKVSGIIKQIDEKGVVIDGTEYQFGKNLANTDFSTGSAYLFRLDHEGRIAYAEYNMSQKNAYGYMTKSYYDDSAEKGYIKIYTAAGEWQKFELANKVRFNDTSKKTEALYNENVLTPQLIVYTLNSQGLVTKIKTGVSGARGEAMNFAELSGKYIYANRSFNSTYFLTDALIFAIPANIDDIELYRVTNCDYLRDGQDYNAKVYNIEENCPEVAVVEEIDTYDTEPFAASSVLLIDEVSVALNYDDVAVTKLKGFCGNQEVEYFFDESVDASELEAGDIIQFTLNADNEIINKKLLVDESNLTYKDEGGFYSNTRKVVGKVCRAYPSAKRFALNLDGSTEVKKDSVWGECSRVASNIYVYDRAMRNGGASLGTVNDIEAGCDIFLRMDREWIYDIVVYRN